MKEIKDYLHLYLGCEILFKCGNEEVVCNIINVHVGGGYALGTSKDGKAFNHYGGFDGGKLIIRPLSDMTEEEILQCGKLICAVPNEEGFSYEIERSHNTVGAKFFSDKYTSGQYLSIWNEKNKLSGIGHIEVGWYNDNKIDKRKTKDLWKVGGCHELTIYLLSKHFDLFGLIEAGLAIDKTTLNP